jgi:hypothetical protein
MIFNEKQFIKDILKECINKNDNNYSKIYDNHYNNLVKTKNIEEIFNLYLDEIDLEDIKYRYGKNYMDIKLNLILYTKFINYIIEKQKEL